MTQRRDLLKLLGLAAGVAIIPSGIWAAVEQIGLSPASDASPSSPMPDVSSLADFSYEILQQQAKALSMKVYVGDRPDVPAMLSALTPEQASVIKIKKDQAISLKSGDVKALPHFRVTKDQIPFSLYKVITGKAQPIPFNPESFDYGSLALGEIPKDLNFSGVSLHGFLKTPSKLDSLFEISDGGTIALAPRNQKRLGASSRVLGVNIADAEAQDIPYFSTLWIEDDQAGKPTVLYGLLDCASVTGAYRMTLKTHNETISLHVESVLYPRKVIKKLCLSPISAMFYKSDNEKSSDVSPKIAMDFRREVHTADGLLVGNGVGEWLWRPLANRHQPRITAQVGSQPKGFGLIQRERRAEMYADPQNTYEQVNSVWVKPLSDFGSGWVELIEVPLQDERNDNIMAYWVLEKPVTPDQTLSFQYELSVLKPEDKVHDLAVVSAFYQQPIGESFLNPLDNKSVRTLLEFSGGNLAYYLQDLNNVTADLFISSGKILSQKVFSDEKRGVISVLFDIDRLDGNTIELRCGMRYKSTVISEIWNKTWFPKDV
jgi:periplasmic glucans biosynthesis protein